MNLKFLLAALLVFAPFARAANPSYGSFETATQFATNNLRIAIKDGVIVTNILAWTGSVEERLRIGGVLSFDHGEFLLPAATNDISVFDASYYRLISDDNTATNRIVRLSAGSFDGQFVILENGADTRFLLRDSDTTWDTGDQVYMVADWSPTNRQSLILLWDGIDTSWIEQERVGNFGGGGELQGTLTPTFIPFANGVTTLGDSGLYSITFTQLGLGDQWTNSFLANNGTQNTWLGNNAGSSLTTASQSVGIGYGAVDSATSSSNLVGVGYNSLTAITTGGVGVTAVGHSSFAALTTGVNATALGESAGATVNANNITFVGNDTGGLSGANVVGIGSQSFELADGSFQSVGVGNSTLRNSQAGNNVAIGHLAMQNAVAANDTFAGGFNALNDVTSGTDNVGIGASVLDGFTTGSSTVAIGSGAGLNNLATQNSIYIGREAGGYSALTSVTNVIVIGHAGNAPELVSTNNNEMFLGNSTNTVLRLAEDRAIHWGTGSPEGVVTANTSSLYLRDDGSTATSLYIKTANDSANTGWTAVDPSGGGGGTLWEYSSDTLRPIADPTRITITTNRQMTLGRATSIPSDPTYIFESGRFRDLGDNARSQFYLWNASDATFADFVDFSLDMTSSATAPYSQLSISAQKASGSNSVFVVRTDNDVTDRIQFNVNGTGRIDMLPNTADGSSAVAYTFDTANYLDDAGAQLARFRNFGTNKVVLSHTGAINILNSAITANEPFFAVTNTWNNAGVTFAGMDINIVDSASAAASAPFQMRVNGTSRAKMDKAGILYLSSNGTDQWHILPVTSSYLRFGLGSSFPGLVDASGFAVLNTGGYRFSSSSSANGAADVFLLRDAAATVQMGADAATATAQTFKAHDGSGTDKAGADFTMAGGQSTGTGIGGARIDKTSLTGSTGSSLNSYSTRRYVYAGEKTLTESTATIVLNIALGSSKYIGGRLLATTHADDATDFQAITDEFTFSAINKAGTVTATIQATPSTSTTAASAGTLTTAWTSVANAATVDLKNSAVSSLTQTTLKVKWQLELNSDDVGTVTP